MNNLLNQFAATRAKTEALCNNLSAEDYIPQAAEFTSPPKWHLAHTTWFFEELILKKTLPEYSVFDYDFSFLFNSYYNTIGNRINRSHRGMITRPTVEQIYAYRKYVDSHITTLLSEKCTEAVKALIVLGINHEQQHQELLITDLKYAFFQNPIYPGYDSKPWEHDSNNDSGWIAISEGLVTVGYDGKGFCYDNELGRHQVFLEDFEISKSNVTNGEFLEFVEAGGYSNAKYWLDDGWSWVESHNISQPLYWLKEKNEWLHFTLSGLQKLDPNAILTHVSFYEAAAFALYKDCRLPTEFEWEAASNKFNWGKRWEWTNSAYLPYPRFRIQEGAVGEYNGKFMVNQMVLRGASVATVKGHSRNTYRNFFYPNRQWQFSGIRLAR